MTLTEQAYDQALNVLRKCATPFGLKASALAGGYPQVWARDSSITALGALLTGDDDLVAAVKASLETLGDKQTDLGMVHLNVDTRTGEVTTENAGAVDANLWFILGHYVYYQTAHDETFLRDSWPRLQRALLWLRYQDMNACGLLEVPEAGDWADLFMVRYNVLYDNMLYVGALRAMSQLAAVLEDGVATNYLELATDVAEKLNLLLWLDRPWEPEWFAAQLSRLKAMRLEWFLLYQNTASLTEIPYYLPWVGFREFGTVFDGFGNMLAVLLGVADNARCQSIFTYAHAVGTNHPYPLKAFYPPITPGDRDWRDYYRSRNLNLPNQYHNGGIWPFLGGLYVSALVSDGRFEEAEVGLEQLAKANQLGKTCEWEFNEWLHGSSGRPMGHPLQAWSAGLYIYAAESVKLGRPPFFSSLVV